MSEFSDDLTSFYVAALRDHLEGKSESTLHQAYELGRTALASGLGVVDLTLLHHSAIYNFVQAHPGSDLRSLDPAAAFLAECLSPFEMMLRGYQETNTQLRTANANLTNANAAVAAANEALKAEAAERERIEAALVHAQKLQAVGLLAGGVAHHFNNLLAVVLGNLDLDRRRLKNGEDIERFLVSATRGAERGAEVVKRLLTFSRQQVLETRIVDTAAWLNTASPLIGSVLRGNIAVEVDVTSPVWSIRIDPAQLELALLNLAVNARDAMPMGGILRLSAANHTLDDKRLGLHGDYVVISVADTGEGVDPQHVSRVFEPFFTTKELGPGAGLGLSQVHGFIHQSGGTIDLESVIGQGTTFHIYLPATFEPVTAVSDASMAHGHQPPLSSKRVLVVDDDIEVAHLASELLEGCGYAVKLVHRAMAALDLLNTGEPIDLVFSDIIMPGMNGLQLAEEVRRRFPKLPILLATGYNEVAPGAAVEGLPIIPKPFSANALCRQVGELIRASAT